MIKDEIAAVATTKRVKMLERKMKMIYDEEGKEIEEQKG